MDHSAHGGMSGMMSESQMNELATNTGAAFDTAFLTMMIEHHDGAVQMARTELTSVKNAGALALASSVVLAQQAEITQMRTLLR